MARMEIISGVERRRRWPDELKMKILAEAERPGARIGQIARRYDLYPSQIRSWRKEFLASNPTPKFLPVSVVDKAAPSSPAFDRHVPSSGVVIEISLRSGRGLKVPADLDRGTLTSLIKCVEAA
jgi:transposase